MRDGKFKKVQHTIRQCAKNTCGEPRPSPTVLTYSSIVMIGTKGDQQAQERPLLYFGNVHCFNSLFERCSSSQASFQLLFDLE